MAAGTHPYDPRGLIQEAYRIDGLSVEEARVIFLDWALSRAAEPDAPSQIAALFAAYGAAVPDHPMSLLLRAGIDGAAPAGRRGGRRGRLG